jgi:hypothetical protein
MRAIDEPTRPLIGGLTAITSSPLFRNCLILRGLVFL